MDRKDGNGSKILFPIIGLNFQYFLEGCITKPLEDYSPWQISIDKVIDAKLVCAPIVGSKFDCFKTDYEHIQKCLLEKAGVRIDPLSKNTISIEMKNATDAPELLWWANVLTVGLIPYSYIADERTAVIVSPPSGTKQFTAIQQTKQERGWWHAITNQSMGFPSDMEERLAKKNCAGITTALSNPPDEIKSP